VLRLYRGKLHLIPLQLRKGDIEDVHEGVDLIRKFSSQTKCSKEIQSAIQQRINEFPAKIKEMKQKSQCYVPVGVAGLLQADPSLVSSAVRVFTSEIQLI